MRLSRFPKNVLRYTRLAGKCRQEASEAMCSHWQEGDRLAAYLFWSDRAADFEVKQALYGQAAMRQAVKRAHDDAPMFTWERDRYEER